MRNHAAAAAAAERSSHNLPRKGHLVGGSVGRSIYLSLCRICTMSFGVCGCLPLSVNSAVFNNCFPPHVFFLSSSLSV